MHDKTKMQKIRAIYRKVEGVQYELKMPNFLQQVNLFSSQIAGIKRFQKIDGWILD